MTPDLAAQRDALRKLPKEELVERLAAVAAVTVDPRISANTARLVTHVALLGKGLHPLPEPELRALLRCDGDKPVRAAKKDGEHYGYLKKVDGGSTPDRLGFLPWVCAALRGGTDGGASAPQGGTAHDSPAPQGGSDPVSPALGGGTTEGGVSPSPEGGTDGAPRAPASLSGVYTPVDTQPAAAVVAAAPANGGGDNDDGFGAEGDLDGEVPAVGPPPRPEGVTAAEIMARALRNMESAAREFRRGIENPTAARAFWADARLIARGEERSVWIDPRPEAKGLEPAPWWDRARLFRLALSFMLRPTTDKSHRGDLRGAIRLALQKQYDPEKLRTAGTPVPGTPHAQQEARYQTTGGAAEKPGGSRQLYGHQGSPTPVADVLATVVPPEARAVDAWLSDPANRQKARELIREGRRAFPRRQGALPPAARRKALRIDLRKRVATLIQSSKSEAA